MTTIQLQSKISEDGILQLLIPPEFKGLNVKITVIVEQIKETNQEPNKLEWLDFIAKNAALHDSEMKL